VLLGCLLIATAPARVQADDDVYMGGTNVEVTQHVQGDLVIAGGHVGTEKRVAGDVLAAGGVVSIGGEVADDVRAVAGDLVLRGRIDGDAIAAGGSVTVGPEAVVGGKAWLAGGDVTVAGRIGGALKVSAGRVRLSGDVGGDVQVIAREVVVEPGAHIGGRLSYRSPVPAQIAPGARIGGPVEAQRFPSPAEEGLPRRALSATKLLYLAGLALAGVVLLRLFPRFALEVARTIGANPWASLGLGLLLLLATPLAGVLLLITIIGIPLAWALLSLYALSLLVAYLTAALFLGDAVARRIGRAYLSSGARIATLVGALVVLFALGYVPMVGGIIQFVALVLGLGAWVLRLYRWHHTRLVSP
jgi:cytoskeletal protein CcmA (bactofilin family)